MFVDLDPNTVNAAKATTAGRLIHPDDYVFGTGGTGKHWAKGMDKMGPTKIGAVMSRITHYVTNWGVKHVWLVGGLGGGTGGGLLSLVAKRVRADHAAVKLGVVAVIDTKNPSPPATAYNQCLSLNVLSAKAHLVTVIHHQSIPAPTATGNAQVASAFEVATRPLRRDGMGIHDLARAAGPTNLLSLFARPKSTRVSDLTPALAALSGPRMSGGKLFGGVAVASTKANLTTAKLLKAPGFPWVAAPGSKIRLKLITSNRDGMALWAAHSGLASPLGELHQAASLLYKRKAFLHWYTGEGMDEMELQRGISHTKKLASTIERAASRATPTRR
jgi:tubulin beta